MKEKNKTPPTAKRRDFRRLVSSSTTVPTVLRDDDVSPADRCAPTSSRRSRRPPADVFENPTKNLGCREETDLEWEDTTRWMNGGRKEKKRKEKKKRKRTRETRTGGRKGEEKKRREVGERGKKKGKRRKQAESK